VWASARARWVTTGATVSPSVSARLLDYQEGRLEGNRGTVAATATDANDAWNVLLKLDVLPSNTPALDICTTLVTYLTSEPLTAAKNSKELESASSGAGSDSKTPTFSRRAAHAAATAQNQGRVDWRSRYGYIARVFLPKQCVEK
jgi:hypothetical protein